MMSESPFATEISLAELIDMVGDDLDTLREIVESFLEDSPRLIQEMVTAIASHDARVAERSAHTLKSSSRLFHAEQFAIQCQSLENAARAENWDLMLSLSKEVQTNYDVIAQTLTDKLEQM